MNVGNVESGGIIFVKVSNLCRDLSTLENTNIANT